MFNQIDRTFFFNTSLFEFQAIREMFLISDSIAILSPDPVHTSLVPAEFQRPRITQADPSALLQIRSQDRELMCPVPEEFPPPKTTEVEGLELPWIHSPDREPTFPVPPIWMSHLQAQVCLSVNICSTQFSNKIVE